MSLIADIQVIFLDDTMLVVNKPAGISTLPDGYDPTLPHIRGILEQQVGRLWIIHRLDKETSGVLLLARSAEAHRSLNMQFEKHAVSKVYHALVNGNPAWKVKTVDLPLKPNGDRRHRTVIDQQAGKIAVTHFKVLERFVAYCLLEARPETGRTHQIRAHLSSIKLPVLGDRLYSKHEDTNHSLSTQLVHQKSNSLTWPSKSMALHARYLEINHPETGEHKKFKAQYPDYFEVALSQLRSDSESVG
jgi:tRNA pseudouridine32 synthase/23S rRNA pseudouridine746 synthase